MIKIFFDMDGTIADLYGHEGWLEKIVNEEEGLFRNLRTIYDPLQLMEIKVLDTDLPLQMEIITWTPMNASPEYCQKVENEKREWALEKFGDVFSQVNVLPYGVPKQYAETKKSQLMILVDDNPEVLAMWETGKQRKGILRTPDLTADELLEKIENLVAGI